MRKSTAVLLDLVAIVVFVSIGRSAHRHGLTIGGELSTLWPFAVGLAAGWGVVRWRHGAGTSRRDGLIIVVTTVALGMVLRVVAGQGTAAAFIVVALVFLTLFLVGWRVVAQLVTSRRA